MMPHDDWYERLTSPNIPCQRCSDRSTVQLHTGFGLEVLCVPCRDAVRREGQEIATPYPLSLEDFAAWQSWREYIRLALIGLDVRKTLAHRIKLAKTNAWLLEKGRRTEWTAIVEEWYRSYNGEAQIP